MASMYIDGRREDVDSMFKYARYNFSQWKFGVNVWRSAGSDCSFEVGYAIANAMRSIGVIKQMRADVEDVIERTSKERDLRLRYFDHDSSECAGESIDDLTELRNYIDSIIRELTITVITTVEEEDWVQYLDTEKLAWYLEQRHNYIGNTETTSMEL